MHLSEIWHSKKNDSRLSRTQVNYFACKISQLFAYLCSFRRDIKIFYTLFEEVKEFKEVIEVKAKCPIAE